MSSVGKREASSHSMTCGAISDCAKSRTVRWSCCCSSVREKSTRVGPQAGVYARTSNIHTVGCGTGRVKARWCPFSQTRHSERSEESLRAGLKDEERALGHEAWRP